MENCLEADIYLYNDLRHGKCLEFWSTKPIFEESSMY